MVAARLVAFGRTARRHAERRQHPDQGVLRDRDGVPLPVDELGRHPVQPCEIGKFGHARNLAGYAGASLSAQRSVLSAGMAPGPNDPVQDRRARVAVSALFLTNGAVFANLLPRYPEIKTDLALTNAAYGAVAAAFPAGALVAGLAAGVVIR